MGMGKIMVGSATNKVAFILLVTFAITIPCLEAGIGDFDDFLKDEADKAHNIALSSYVPKPEEVADELNIHVNLYVLPISSVTSCLFIAAQLVKKFFDIICFFNKHDMQ